MKPKKAKEFIPQVAKELNLSEDIVEAVTSSYWREVWVSLTNLVDIKVHVHNFGDFNIKHWRLDPELQKLHAIQSTSTLKAPQRYKAGLKVAESIELINNLKDKLEDERQRKEFTKEHRQAMETNSTDPGRIL